MSWSGGRLGELLAERDRTNLTPSEMADIRRRMKIEIVTGWGTNTVRRIKPTVEVRSARSALRMSPDPYC